MRNQVLKLYKNLLRYSENVKLTDKKYLRFRIRSDFHDNIDLHSPKDIKFHLEVIN